MLGKDEEVKVLLTACMRVGRTATLPHYPTNYPTPRVERHHARFDIVTVNTPRAHITNMAALECLRDISLEAEYLIVAIPNDSMMHTRWYRSISGKSLRELTAGEMIPLEPLVKQAQRSGFPLKL